MKSLISRHNIAILIIISLILSLQGCAYIMTEKTYFYSLSAAQKSDLPAAPDSTVSIGLGPLKFPELLDRPQIVSRSGDHTIIRASNHYWGGSLETEFMQVLADNLQLTLDSNQILVYPWDNRRRPDYQLRGAITRFDGELGSTILLQTRWQLISSKKGQKEIIRSSTIEKQTHSESYEDYVSALSEAIHELAKEITTCIQTSEC